MSSPSVPSGQITMTQPGGHAADVDALLSDGTEIDASRGAPPAEVLEQMSVAADRLRRARRRLRFSTDAPGRCTKIELIDGRGGIIRDLSVSEAIDIASGKSSL